MKFISKYREMCYVIKPAYFEIINGIRVNKPGKRVQFSNFELETNDEEVINYLKNHESFGSTLFCENGEKEEKELKCPECDFVAKSQLGLVSHRKKHFETKTTSMGTTKTA